MVLTLRAENPPRFLGRMTLITTPDSTTGSTVRIQKKRIQKERNSGASCAERGYAAQVWKLRGMDKKRRLRHEGKKQQARE
jgi:hypothetical protein